MAGLLRWCARILGLLSNIATLFILFIIFFPVRDFPLQQIPALAGLLAANAGVILTWKWERQGSFLAITAGLFTAISLYFGALAVGVAQQSSLITSLIYGGPFILVGGLFFLSSRNQIGIKSPGNLKLYGLTVLISLILTSPLLVTGLLNKGNELTAVPTNRPVLNQTDYPPILFVHGNVGNAAEWLNTVWLFESNGYPADRLFTLSMTNPTAPMDTNNPTAGTATNDNERTQLAAKVDEVLAKTGAKKVVLAANSRGGTVIRNYLLRGGGAAKVSQVMLGGTPNHGVLAAPIMGNFEFNGSGEFITDLNKLGESVPGVEFLSMRSDRYDKYAQLRGLSSPIGSGYHSPELAGATNIVLNDLDHRELAYSPRAFEQMFRFVTGKAPATLEVKPEAAPYIGGDVTGYLNGNPTNTGVSGVKVAVYEVDQKTGQRKGSSIYSSTTGPDGSWGGFTGKPDAYYEFELQPPGMQNYYYFRSPFLRSTKLATFRLQPEPVRTESLVVYIRPRGYVSDSRDSHSLDGKLVPGVEIGVPITPVFKVVFPGPERGVPASLNGESITVRTVQGAIVYAEFTR